MKIYDRFSFFVYSMVMLCLFLTLSTPCAAQGQDVAMADVMRSNGKIYMVVAVCLTILIGLLLYVISIDRKISKIEKE